MTREQEHPMTIAIIGAGNVGTALAGAFVRAGHDVAIASRHRADAITAGRVSGAQVADTNRAAVAGADIVVLAVPFSEAEAVSAEIAVSARGRIVVDVSNPVAPTMEGLLTDGGPSAAERIQALLPDAFVVKALNTVFAGVQSNARLHDEDLDGFVAGDDARARDIVVRLVSSIGLRAIDVGSLRSSRYLEGLAFLNIALQVKNGWGWQSAWKLIGIPDEWREPAMARAEPVAAGSIA